MFRRHPLLLPGVCFVAFSWALNTVIVKYAVSIVDPLAFTGLRFLVMTPLAFVLARAMRQSVSIRKRDLPMLIACGACGYGLYQYFWVIGLAHTSAFASSLFASLSPLLTLSIVAFTGEENVRAGRWIGAAIALLGVAVFEGAFAGHVTFRAGDLLTFCAAAIFAIFNVISARLLRSYTPLGLVAISMTIGTAMILPGAIPRMAHQNLAVVTPVIWAILAYAVIFPILLTFPVWSWAISKLGAGRASLFQFIVPVIAGLLAIALLHDRIEPHQIAGTAICIAGMAAAQLFGRFSFTDLWAERTVSLK